MREFITMLTEVWSELKQGHDSTWGDKYEPEEDHIVHADVACAYTDPISAILPVCTPGVFFLIGLLNRLSKSSHSSAK